LRAPSTSKGAAEPMVKPTSPWFFTRSGGVRKRENASGFG
jgi:hypothetical protein